MDLFNYSPAHCKLSLDDFYYFIFVRIVNYHCEDFYYLIFMRIVNYHSFFDRREEEEKRKEKKKRKKKKKEVMNRRVIEKIFLGALRPQKPYRF